MYLSYMFISIHVIYIYILYTFSGCGPKGGGSVGDQLISLDSSDNCEVVALGPARHMVYAGVFPADQSQHPFLNDAIKKLALNDSAVAVTADSRYLNLH